MTQLVEVFAEGWSLATREELEGEGCWFPNTPPAGNVSARAIADGPDENLDALRWAFLGAIAAARWSIRVVTPYFLPDESLIARSTARHCAALPSTS